MKTIDADAILARATPAAHQQGHEIQPFNHLVKMPIALAHATCAESVENLNRLLADTISLRDLYKKLVPGDSIVFSCFPLCRSRMTDPPRHVTCVVWPRTLSHRDMLLGPSQHEGTALQNPRA